MENTQGKGHHVLKESLRSRILEILFINLGGDGRHIGVADKLEKLFEDRNQLSDEELLIVEAIMHGRRIQDYLWQELSLLNQPYDPEKWESIFGKRVKKISEIDPSFPSAKVELRKRILQQAALSILALQVLDKKQDYDNDR